jgi:hypothetical protein
MKILFGRILAYALMSELIAVFFDEGWDSFGFNCCDAFLEHPGLASAHEKHAAKIVGEPSLSVGNAFLQKLVRKNLRFAM